MFVYLVDTYIQDIYNDRMKTISKLFHPKITYDLSRIDDPEQILFFDIETTGLSSKTAMIYLIGCTYLTSEGWTMKQWFADSETAEKEILLHFLMFASRFRTLVHFNGDTFDIPFVRDRVAFHELEVTLKPAVSFDLYKKVRRLKCHLGTCDCRQKTMEQLLGIGREDTYTGGELIEVYHSYRKNPNEEAYHFLLLHNEEDIRNLPVLTNLLHFLDLPEASFRFCSMELESYRSYAARKECLTEPDCKELLVQFAVEGIRLPARYSAKDEIFRLIIQENKGILRVPVVDATLRLFFPDYKDYFYLPDEDRAIHKSIAAFVEKSARKKATAKTCYQNQQGSFIPVPKCFETEKHIFRTEYKKEPRFLLVKDADFEDSEFLKKFLLALLL